MCLTLKINFCAAKPLPQRHTQPAEPTEPATKAPAFAAL
jgi:hypothetical protein